MGTGRGFMDVGGGVSDSEESAEAPASSDTE
jgi:hypothetical protein